MNLEDQCSLEKMPSLRLSSESADGGCSMQKREESEKQTFIQVSAGSSEKKGNFLQMTRMAEQFRKIHPR